MRDFLGSQTAAPARERTRRADLANMFLDLLLNAVRLRDRTRGLFRTALDNWFAYEVGCEPLLNGKGNPRWFNKPNPSNPSDKAFLSLCHWSSEAAALAIKAQDSTHLVKEHALPVEVLRRRMDERAFASREEARAFLRSWYRLGVVTKVEHSLLKSSRMPTRWTPPDGPFARYTAAGVDGSPQQHDLHWPLEAEW